MNVQPINCNSNFLKNNCKQPNFTALRIKENPRSAGDLLTIDDVKKIIAVNQNLSILESNYMTGCTRVELPFDAATLVQMLETSSEIEYVKSIRR